MEGQMGNCIHTEGGKMQKRRFKNNFFEMTNINIFF